MIRHSMCFDGFCDFYNRRLFIRATYGVLNRDEKAIYKYYVYSRRILRERTCDCIWGYINAEDKEEIELYSQKLEEERNRYL